MNSCDLSDRGIAALAVVLENAPNLTHLDLSWNTLGHQSVTAMAGALASSSSIIRLGLGHTGMSDKDAVFICQALSVQKTWLAIDFSGTHDLSLTARPGAYECVDSAIHV